MKAITLYQPWAYFVAQGLKQYETRGWPTAYRGFLAIHAAKRDPREFAEWVQGGFTREHWLSMTMNWGEQLERLPVGRIVGVVLLTDCQPAQHLETSLSPLERHLGDYGPGRFAWKLAHPIAVGPWPARGMQGLWDWTPDTNQMEAIIKALEAAGLNLGGAQ